MPNSLQRVTSKDSGDVQDSQAGVSNREPETTIGNSSTAPSRAPDVGSNLGKNPQSSDDNSISKYQPIYELSLCPSSKRHQYSQSKTEPNATSSPRQRKSREQVGEDRCKQEDREDRSRQEDNNSVKPTNNKSRSSHGGNLGGGDPLEGCSRHFNQHTGIRNKNFEETIYERQPEDINNNKQLGQEQQDAQQQLSNKLNQQKRSGDREEQQPNNPKQQNRNLKDQRDKNLQQQQDNQFGEQQQQLAENNVGEPRGANELVGNEEHWPQQFQPIIQELIDEQLQFFRNRGGINYLGQQQFRLRQLVKEFQRVRFKGQRSTRTARATRSLRASRRAFREGPCTRSWKHGCGKK